MPCEIKQRVCKGGGLGKGVDDRLLLLQFEFAGMRSNGGKNLSRIKMTESSFYSIERKGSY